MKFLFMSYAFPISVTHESREKIRNFQLGMSALFGFLLVCHLTLTFSRGHALGADQRLFAHIPADFVIGAIFSVHERPLLDGSGQALVCGNITEMFGVQRVEAALHTIDLINENPNLLPNISLGIEVRDGCWSSPVALHQTISFLERYVFAQTSEEFCDETAASTVNSTMIGVIGPASATLAVQVYYLLQLFDVPEVGYSITADDFSDKVRYRNFLRTVPPDVYQASAMLAVMRHFGWTYISLVYTDETYGQNGAKTLKRLLLHEEACVAFEEGIQATESADKYEKLVYEMSKDVKANVVVCYCDDVTVRKIFAALRKYNLSNRFLFIGSDDWTGLKEASVLGFEDEAQSSILIGISSTLPGFKQYYKSLNPYSNKRNPWFAEFWQKKFKCRLDNSSSNACTGNEDVGDSTVEDSKLGFISMSIYTLAQGLHNLIKDICGPSLVVCDRIYPFNGSLFRDYLFNVSLQLFDDFTFSFDENGDPTARYELLNFQNIDGKFEHVKIGEYTPSKGLLIKKSVQVPLGKNISTFASVCAHPCFPGTYKKTENKKCCWVCVTCAEYEYSADEETCKPCEMGYWPNVDRTGCYQLTPFYLQWSSLESLFCISFSCLGMLATITFAIIFARYNDTPVVKSSNRPLSYAMLLGMLVAHASTFFVVAKPSPFNCSMTRILPGMGFCIIYACLATKIQHIARIVALSKKWKPNRKRVLMSTKAQISISCVLITIEAAICWYMLSSEPADSTLYFHSRDNPQLICNTTTEGLAIPLVLNAILICACTYYAFLTRNIPENFNETKFIGFSMYTTLITWFAFTLVYHGSKWKVMTICVCVTTNALVMLCFLFGPKVYIILMRPERNTRAFFTTAKGIRCHIGNDSSRVGININTISTDENYTCSSTA